MTTFGDRLKELREEFGYTQKQLSEKLNFKSASTIGMYERGERGVDPETLVKLSTLFNVSTDYLLGKTLIREEKNNASDIIIKELDESQDRFIHTKEKIAELKTEISNMEKNPELFNSESYKTNTLLLKDYELELEHRINANNFAKDGLRATLKGLSEQLIPFKKLNPKKIMVVPVLGSIRAGKPILAEEHIEGYFPIDRDLAKGGKDYFYLKVVGDSMDKEFKEGSMVLVEHQNHNYFTSGEIGVVLINGFEATVKKIIINDNKITLIPCSNNPEYKEETYDMAKDEIRIIGRVVLAVKKY